MKCLVSKLGSSLGNDNLENLYYILIEAIGSDCYIGIQTNGTNVLAYGRNGSKFNDESDVHEFKYSSEIEHVAIVAGGQYFVEKKNVAVIMLQGACKVYNIGYIESCHELNLRFLQENSDYVLNSIKNKDNITYIKIGATSGSLYPLGDFKNVNEINVLEEIGGTITSKEGGEVEVFAERLLSNGKIGDLKLRFGNALAYLNSIRRNAPTYYMRFSSNNIKIYSDSSYTVQIAEYNGSVWSYM